MSQDQWVRIIIIMHKWLYCLWPPNSRKIIDIIYVIYDLIIPCIVINITALVVYLPTSLMNSCKPHNYVPLKIFWSVIISDPKAVVVVVGGGC